MFNKPDPPSDPAKLLHHSVSGTREKADAPNLEQAPEYIHANCPSCGRLISTAKPGKVACMCLATVDLS